MGKKAKIGKDRKDKFYKLAKETGFRSRAAFKLIQLNRKFGFLQQSQVCIDLCAAPGGWMQVAKQNMPVSSIVIGVDLFPIKSVPGCISLMEDITTDKCKQALTKELQSWKADVVLHDGAPNVGKNWLYDAYQQICLTLQAVKLATHFLRGGGWFVTKVFRSKDYNALLWVLKQLFKKVHATKPSASRKESAEIFVVCQYYIAPERIDAKLLDAKYVFEELDLDAGNKQTSLLHPDASKRIKAEGYSERDFAQRSTLNAGAFVAASSGLNALQGIGEIVFDAGDEADRRVAEHAKTTAEIRECCKDIKVLGRKDMRNLLAWWKVLRAEFHPAVAKEPEGEEKAAEEPKRELTAEELEDMEQDELERHIAELEADAGKDDKRKRKKVQKARSKLNEKLNLKMVIKGDPGPREEDNEVFSLRDITSAAMLDELQDQSPDTIVDEHAVQGDEFMPKFKRYVKGETVIDDDGQYHDDAEAESDDEAGESDMYADDSDDSERLGKLGLDLGSDDEAGHDRRKKNGKKLRGAAAKAESGKGRDVNPLLDDLDTRDKDSKRQQRVQLWFAKDTLKELDENVDEDRDLDKLTSQYRQKGVTVLGDAVRTNEPAKNDRALGKKAKRRARHAEKAAAPASDDEVETDSDDGLSDDEAELQRTTRREGGTDGYEVVSQTAAVKPKRIKLDEEELALGALMVQSRKSRRDLIESAWNRYAFNDENLPEWFVADEMQNMRKEAPVPKELADEYRKKLDELNVRPIKKVMEAKARKKRRAVKRFEKAKKKAEAVLENADSNAADKVRQIKKLYKKAQDEKKKEVEYVVTRRHLAAKRVRRPAGVKGRFKVVDPRMKKDKRAAVAKEKTKGRGKKR